MVLDRALPWQNTLCPSEAKFVKEGFQAREGEILENVLEREEQREVDHDIDREAGHDIATPQEEDIERDDEPDLDDDLER